MDVSIVIPTIGSDSLQTLLRALTSLDGSPPREIVIVDYRRASTPVNTPIPHQLRPTVCVFCIGDYGRAAACNIGWRLAKGRWVAFLDEDVVPTATWLEDLQRDLDALSETEAGSRGNVRVPVPIGPKPRRSGRTVASSEEAVWAPDIVYRRDVLARLDAFDERFRPAFREDRECGLPLLAQGLQMRRGERVVDPVRSAGRWVSVSPQRGNCEDAVKDAPDEPGPYRTGQAPLASRLFHLAIVASALAAMALAATGNKRLAASTGALWFAATAELAWQRIRQDRRSSGEILTLAASSTLIPFITSYHYLSGLTSAGWKGACLRPTLARLKPSSTK